jgi:5-epi-alpha-selinene synthase
VATLGALAVDVISWSNDLYSYGRESTSQRSIVVHNLVSVIAGERRRGAQEALDEACAMHERGLATYGALMPATRRRADPALRRYLDGLGTWMTGNEGWSFSTARHRSADDGLVIEDQ